MLIHLAVCITNISKIVFVFYAKSIRAMHWHYSPAVLKTVFVIHKQQELLVFLFEILQVYRI